ncbi:hypothetical protein II898_00940 [bacterium]|nr:hypothetical protein [bacterium]
MFAKMIGVCVTIFILGKFTGIGGEQIEYFMNIVKITLTQHEVNSIAHQIYGNTIVDGRIPDQSSEDWAKYIRANMKADVPGRDSAKDYWDKFYEVREVDQVPGLSKEGFIVKSCGPDTLENTEDDITSGYEYNN